MLIDVGGTPANILKKKNVLNALENGINEKEIIAILDPFDLSRAERKFEYNGKSIKFSISSNDISKDSEKESILFSENIPTEIKSLANNSKNLRDLMNNVVRFIYPNLKTIRLDEVLSSNKKIISNIAYLMVIAYKVNVICRRNNIKSSIYFIANIFMYFLKIFFIDTDIVQFPVWEYLDVIFPFFAID